MSKPDQVKSNFAQMEESILAQWKDQDILKQVLAKDSPKGNFIFFEGPPTANGKPALHHVLARSFKDIMIRYKTMQGFHVERKAGWDTHGLPVELQVEKALAISGKPDIEKYGIKEFNQKCKESVWQYKNEWELLTERIGFWLDMKNAYATYKNEYIESLWWILKELHQKDLLYKGFKVVPHCPRCGTALSSHEVAQGYKLVKEPSVYIKFKVKDQDNTYILSWTTTPWTLPGNVALTVGAEIDYVKIKVNDEFLIIAKARLGEVITDEYEIIEEYKGKDLVNWEYEPLFAGAVDPGDKKAWYVAAADFVTTTDGTGVVHTAAMYGEDDFNFALEHDLPLVHTVGEDGKFLESVTKWAGKFVKSKTVETEIISDLNDRNLLLKEVGYEHDYPFCWRCDTPLLYFATDSWFLKVTAVKDDLIKNNQDINWVPAHIKDGRFGEWLNNIKDWAISRQRYWGTPLPIWECSDCNKFEVIGSYEELEAKTGGKPEDDDGNFDVHRPFVDELTFKCECGGTKQRVKEVFDVWYDSGAMPFAQSHYPFENSDLIDKNQQYPADYISEAIDQTRGWFYTLLSLSTMLGKGTSYKNVICLGHIRDKNGKKMSKSKGNVVDPFEVADKFGIDAVRMHLYTMNNPGDPKNFDEKGVAEVMRKVMMLLSNVYSFYAMFADDTVKATTDSSHPLDQWLLARTNKLIQDVTIALDEYDVFRSGRALITYIDELSTWYVRRSRDRIKGDDVADKQAALSTLRYALETTIKLLAPFCPFITESLFYKLYDNNTPQTSVHMANWPKLDASLNNDDLLQEMAQIQKIVEMGHSLRTEGNMKVRQALATLELPTDLIKNKALLALIKDELNLKQVIEVDAMVERDGWLLKEEGNIKLALDTNLTPELIREGLIREFIRQINGTRKKQGLTINDRVDIKINTDVDELQTLINEAGVEIAGETLANKIEFSDSMSDNAQTVKINGNSVQIDIIN